MEWRDTVKELKRIFFLFSFECCKKKVGRGSQCQTAFSKIIIIIINPTAFWKQTTLQFFKSNQNSHLLHKGFFFQIIRFSYVLHMEKYNIIYIYLHTGSKKKNKQNERAKQEVKPNCTLLHWLLLEAVTFNRVPQTLVFLFSASTASSPTSKESWYVSDAV